jgi:PPOX class probable F420-dependent enzyme
MYQEQTMVTIDTSTDFGKRVAEQLEKNECMWLTTVDADGTPQPVPVWFYWDGETFLIYSQPNKPKLRNIENNPRVALHFDTDEHGRTVTTFIGTAKIDPSAPPADQLPSAYFEKYQPEIDFMGWTREKYLSEYTVPIQVTPEKLRGW